MHLKGISGASDSSSGPSKSVDSWVDRKGYRLEIQIFSGGEDFKGLDKRKKRAER